VRELQLRQRIYFIDKLKLQTYHLEGFELEQSCFLGEALIANPRIFVLCRLSSEFLMMEYLLRQTLVADFPSVGTCIKTNIFD